MKIRFQIEELQSELAKLKSEVKEIRSQIDSSVGGMHKMVEKMRDQGDAQEATSKKK